MRIGWIDFSPSDKKKVVDVLNMYAETGAVDELGIGTIRDAFANYFFPGSSTIQTRAKYFFIVPYLLADAAYGKFGLNYQKAYQQFLREEASCCVQLAQNARKNGEPLSGIIGHTSLNQDTLTLKDKGTWVVRKPSDIYWSGIRTLHIFRNSNLTILNYLRISLASLNDKDLHASSGTRRKKNEDEDIEGDDAFSGDGNFKQFWSFTWNPYWQEDLNIHLTEEEADLLCKLIDQYHGTTLLNALLKNDIHIQDLKETYRSNLFKGVSDLARAKCQTSLSDETWRIIDLANQFSEFIYAARICYNRVLSNDANTEALEEWEQIKDRLPEIAELEIDEMMKSLKVVNYPLNKFLKDLKAAYVQESPFETIKEIIVKREVDLKGRSRAKLLKPSETNTVWLSGRRLDYRANTVSIILKDIFDAKA